MWLIIEDSKDCLLLSNLFILEKAWCKVCGEGGFYFYLVLRCIQKLHQHLQGIFGTKSVCVLLRHWKERNSGRDCWEKQDMREEARLGQWVVLVSALMGGAWTLPSGSPLTKATMWITLQCYTYDVLVGFSCTALPPAVLWPWRRIKALYLGFSPKSVGTQQNHTHTSKSSSQQISHQPGHNWAHSSPNYNRATAGQNWAAGAETMAGWPMVSIFWMIHLSPSHWC